MNIPTQSRPVSRGARLARVAHPARVRPSGDGCSAGSWCCSEHRDGSHPSCVSCNTIPCLLPHEDFCAFWGKFPTDRC